MRPPLPSPRPRPRPRRSRGRRSSPRRVLGAALALAALFFAPPSAEAQRDAPRWEGPDLRGRVVDVATGAPLPGAGVAVPNLDRQTFADTEGRFTLPDLAAGENVLMVSHLGYENVVEALVVDEEAVADDSIVTVEIALAPRPIELEGLEIMADRFERRTRAAPVATRVIDRAEIVRSNAIDAFELLRSRSGLNVSYCPASNLAERYCITRYGQRVSPELLVDEMPIFWGLEELEYFPVEAIYRIEVYDRRHIRVYTVDWMRTAAVNRPNLPYVRFPNHFRPSWRSSRGPGWQ